MSAAAPAIRGSRIPAKSQDAKLATSGADLDPALHEFAENALWAEEENQQEHKIQQAGGDGVGDVGGYYNLKDRDQHGADHRAGNTAPTADDDGDIGVDAERDSAGRIDEELV